MQNRTSLPIPPQEIAILDKEGYTNPIRAKTRSHNKHKALLLRRISRVNSASLRRTLDGTDVIASSLVDLREECLSFLISSRKPKNKNVCPTSFPTSPPSLRYAIHHRKRNTQLFSEKHFSVSLIMHGGRGEEGTGEREGERGEERWHPLLPPSVMQSTIARGTPNCSPRNTSHSH